MALTRSMLSAMGIESEKIEEIIKSHTESTDALKKQRDEAKDEAEQLRSDLKGYEKAKKELEELRNGEDPYKAKYETIQKELADFKAGIAKEKTDAEKKSLYRELLKGAGIDEKRFDAIIKVTDMDAIELSDGKLKDSEALANAIKDEWAGFIVSTGTEGANVPNPPKGGDGGDLTDENIKAVRKAMGLPDKE